MILPAHLQAALSSGRRGEWFREAEGLIHALGGQPLFGGLPVGMLYLHPVQGPVGSAGFACSLCRGPQVHSLTPISLIMSALNLGGVPPAQLSVHAKYCGPGACSLPLLHGTAAAAQANLFLPFGEHRDQNDP